MPTKNTKPAAEAPEQDEPEVDIDSPEDVAALLARLQKTSPDKQLHAKLADIMRVAQRIPKRGQAPQAMGSYRFVQVGDAADHIRRALGRRNISMLPSGIEVINRSEHASGQGGQKTMTTVELVQTWTLKDGDTGEEATIQSYGVGADTGDKFSGKAMTNAMKYALLTGFLLSTGDDVEGGDTSDRQPRGPQQPPPSPTRSSGRVPAQGGKQADQTKPQRQIIGELLRKLGGTTAEKAAALITEVSGKEITLGEDKGASLQKALDEFTSNESGKLVHDLRKLVEAKEGGSTEAAAETEAETVAGGAVSNPDAPAGEPADESLEAGSAL